MTRAQRNAGLKIDWANLNSKLGLRGSTAQSLASFKKRNDDARRRVQVLSEQPQNVDFAHYRSILKNGAIVDDIEKQVNSYQIKKYDVSRQLKAIDAFEAQAVKSAEETKVKVDSELKDLEKTLQNIEGARPFEDLTTVCYTWSFGTRIDMPMLITTCCRRMSPLLGRTSTSVHPRSWQRVAGMCQVTTYVPALSDTKSSANRRVGTFR